MTQRQQNRQNYANNARNNYWDHHNDWGHNGWYGWGGYGWGWNNWWGPLAWSGVTGFLGGLTGSLIGGAFYDHPVEYSYGSSGGGYSDGGYTEYTGGETIIVNNEPQPAQEYAQQAYTIADNYDSLVAPTETAVPTSTDATVPAAPQLDWTPLGIYAAMDETRAQPHQFYQLVLSNDGAIGGTYRDTDTNAELPIKGSLDPKSQRVAFKVGDQPFVMETGLYNLTQPEAPALVHNGTDNSYQVTLIRMEQPTTATGTAAPEAATPVSADTGM